MKRIAKPTNYCINKQATRLSAEQQQHKNQNNPNWAVIHQLSSAPASSVGALLVFQGPTPPELTAETLMTYIVNADKLVSSVMFLYFSVMELMLHSKPIG